MSCCCPDIPAKIKIIWQYRYKQVGAAIGDDVWSPWQGDTDEDSYFEAELGVEETAPAWWILAHNPDSGDNPHPHITLAQVRYKIRNTPSESCKLKISGLVTYVALDGFTVTGTYTLPDVLWAGAGSPCMPPGLDFTDSTTWDQNPADWIEIPTPPSNGSGSVQWTLDITP